MVFTNFLADMGESPPDKTIGRIDNDGNYEPGNCEWQANEQQNRSKHSNVWITFDGTRLCLTDWAKLTGIHLARSVPSRKQGGGVTGCPRRINMNSIQSEIERE